MASREKKLTGEPRENKHIPSTKPGLESSSSTQKSEKHMFPSIFWNQNIPFRETQKNKTN